MSTALTGLREALDGAVADVAGDTAPKSAPALERPRQAEHGDYATNAAMMLAGPLGAPPREVAERLSEALAERLGAELTAAEVAGPGFLNLVLSDLWYERALDDVLAAGERWGGGGADPAL